MAGEGFFRSKKYVIVALRFLTLVSLLVIIWFQFEDIESLPGWLVAVIIVVLAGSNVWLIVMPKHRFKSQMLYGWIFIADLVVVTLLMIAVAGVQFYVVFVPYAVVIGITAYTRKLSSAFFIVIMAALVYAALIVTAGKGSELLSTPFLTWVVLFFLTAFFVGYLAEEVKRELEMQEKLELTERAADEVRHELGELRSLHELVTESIPVGLVVFDESFVVEYANPEFAAMFGAPRGAIEGREIGTVECAHETLQNQLRNLLALAVEKKAATGANEFLCEVPGGGTMTVLCNIYPIAREDTKLRMVAVLEDVTNMRKIEDARLEKMRIESQLKILSSLSGAMSSLGSFRQIISRFPSATEPILSFTACGTLELEKEPLFIDLYLTAKVSRKFVQQVRKRMSLSLAQLVAEFPADKEVALEVDELLVTEDADAEMESFLAVPVVVENKTLALIGFASTTPDAFKPEDISFAYTLANYYSLILARARVEEEMLRREVDDQLHRERLKLEAAKKEAEIEATRRSLDAERKAVRELKRIDELKSEFISTVSHEMRTPMTSIKSSMDLLLSGRLGEIQKEHKPFLEIAVRNIDRLAQLTDDVLNVSRIESGRVKMAPGIHEVEPVVEAVLNTLATKLDENSAVVETELSGGLKAYFDRNSLTQVFTNLIANAVNHNQPGVHVRVSVVSQEEGFLTISVADDGVGILESERSKVFDRFYQSGRTYGEGSKGTGLGLTISRGLVKAMGGKMWVEGEEGKGADFRLTLPLTKDVLAGPDEKSSPPAESELYSEVLFGKIAVLMKFVAAEQVRECAREQAAGESTGRLGEILVRKGYMIPEQRDLVLDVQAANLARPSPHNPDKTLADTILGGLAVSHGLLEQEQLGECLREQALLESEGKPVLLGELLVRKKYLTIEQILGLLAEQKGAQMPSGSHQKAQVPKEPGREDKP